MTTGSGLARLAGAAALLAWGAPPSLAQQAMRLTLGEATRFAAARGAGTEAARARQDIAMARLRQQRADLLPTLAATLSEGARTFNSSSYGLTLRDPASGGSLLDPSGQVLGPVRAWDVRATARQSLVDFSAFARIGAGRLGVVAAEADAANASQQAAVAAATAYVHVVWAEALVAARQADSALAGELLALAKTQQQVGMGTLLDVTRAQAQLAAARAQLIAARTDRERARLELLRTLDLPFDAPLTLADSLLVMPATFPVPSEAEATERALRMRTDVRMNAAQREVAKGQLAAIRAERLPVLSLFADGGRTGNGIARLLYTYSWGVQVSIPLFDGLRREERIAEQQAAIREQDVRRRDLMRQVRLDVRVALVQLASASERLHASDERLALAEQELELARRRFTEGMGGNADVITALLSVSAARTQTVNARAEVQAARVALARAQGVVTELP